MCDEVVVHLRRPMKLYIRGIYVDIDIIKWYIIRSIIWDIH